MMETEKSGKTVHDSGWNDPPLLANSLQSSSKPRTLLNKRIAYPLLGSPVSNNSTFNKSALPPSINLAPPSENKIEQSKNNGELLSRVLTDISELLSDASMDSKKIEITKRIEVMETMWREGKLNAKMQKQMVELTDYLKHDKLDEANKVYVDMMMNNAALGSTWMIGIKYLIHLKFNPMN